jgi:predicted MFS family arabinose efflux permease
VAFRRTAPPPAAPGGIARRLRADIGEGLAWLWRHRLVRTLTLVGFGLSVSGGAVVGVLVVYGVRALGLGRQDARLGLLYSASAAGGLAATLLLPRATRWLGRERVALLALTANAPVLAAVALAPGFAVGLVLLLVWNLSYTMVTVNIITIRQLATPDQLQSRVNATGRLLAWGLGWPVGAALGGVLTDLTTVRTAYLIMAAVVLATAVAAWLSPLRHGRAVADPGNSRG